jgi:hypothetical protein
MMKRGLVLGAVLMCVGAGVALADRDGDFREAVRLSTCSTGSVLTAAHMFVGNAAGVAADVAISGDVGVSTSGVVTVTSGAISSGKIADGTISNVDVAAGAAIDRSKLNLGGISVTNTFLTANSTVTNVMTMLNGVITAWTTNGASIVH